MAIALAAAPVAAQERAGTECPPTTSSPPREPDGFQLVLPPHPDEPTTASVGLFLTGVREIDEGADTFTVEGTLDVVWCDARLAFDASDLEIPHRLYLGEAAIERLTSIWSPGLTLARTAEATAGDATELTIRSDGTVTLREGFRAVLGASFEMRRFPFDRQQLPIEIRSTLWGADHLLLTSAGVTLADDFRIRGWTVGEAEVAVVEGQGARDRTRFSSLTATVHVDRDPGFFVLKVMVPLAIIVLMLAGLFWTPVSDSGMRVRGAIAGLLTVAAYGFVVSRFVPIHVYSSFLDAFVLASFVFPAVLMVLVVMSGRRYETDGGAAAKSFDRTARAIYVVGYAGVTLLLAVAYLLV